MRTPLLTALITSTAFMIVASAYAATDATPTKSKAETTKAAATKSETAKSETSKSETAKSEIGKPEIGKPAPEFSTTGVGDEPVSTTAYKGRIVVLEWTNPDCPFVHKHYDSHNMQQLQDYAQSKGVVWISINSSAPGKEGNMDQTQARNYLSTNQLHINHYVLDPEGKIGKLYAAKTTPHMFVIDTKGNLAYMGAIDNKPDADKESTKTAKNYVRAAIDSLIAGKPVETASTQSYGCYVKYSN